MDGVSGLIKRAAAENVGDKEKQLATWATAIALTVGDNLDDEKNK